MNFRKVKSVTILSKSSLKQIVGAGDPPDCGTITSCDDIPRELWKETGCV